MSVLLKKGLSRKVLSSQLLSHIDSIDVQDTYVYIYIIFQIVYYTIEFQGVKHAQEGTKISSYVKFDIYF